MCNTCEKSSIATVSFIRTSVFICQYHIYLQKPILAKARERSNKTKALSKTGIIKKERVILNDPWPFIEQLDMAAKINKSTYFKIYYNVVYLLHVSTYVDILRQVPCKGRLPRDITKVYEPMNRCKICFKKHSVKYILKFKIQIKHQNSISSFIFHWQPFNLDITLYNSNLPV